MKFAVPIYAVINVNDPAQASRVKEALETLLAQEFLKMTIRSQGVPLEGALVGDPYQVRDDFNVNQPKAPVIPTRR